jgi:pantetheine-phosphate adenylyltransferase
VSDTAGKPSTVPTPTPSRHPAAVTRLAVYAGSFDPVTYGHLDLIERASALFSDVIVAIGVHPTRKALFTAGERLEILRKVCEPFDNVTVESFDGLLIEYCKSVRARVVVRGLRAATDFEYELQIAHANADIRPEIDTIFLPTRTKHGFVSASLVREIGSHHGDVSRYAPEVVQKALIAKFPQARKAGDGTEMP